MTKERLDQIRDEMAGEWSSDPAWVTDTLNELIAHAEATQAEIERLTRLNAELAFTVKWFQEMRSEAASRNDHS